MLTAPAPLGVAPSALPVVQVQRTIERDLRLMEKLCYPEKPKEYDHGELCQ